MSNVAIQRKHPNWVASVLGNVTKLAGKEIACGFPKGKLNRYQDTQESVADVAAQNCFGIGVPQRDFMTYALPLIVTDTAPFMNEIVKENNIPGHESAVTALMEHAGQLGAAAIKEAIEGGNWPDNSEVTKKRKGEGKKPLIDTSLMINSVTYVVRDAR
jgi:hypothetical protein